MENGLEEAVNPERFFLQSGPRPCNNGGFVALVLASELRTCAYCCPRQRLVTADADSGQSLNTKSTSLSLNTNTTSLEYKYNSVTADADSGQSGYP